MLPSDHCSYLPFQTSDVQPASDRFSYPENSILFIATIPPSLQYADVLWLPFLLLAGWWSLIRALLFVAFSPLFTQKTPVVGRHPAFSDRYHTPQA